MSDYGHWFAQIFIHPIESVLGTEVLCLVGSVRLGTGGILGVRS